MLSTPPGMPPPPQRLPAAQEHSEARPAAGRPHHVRRQRSLPENTLHAERAAQPWPAAPPPAEEGGWLRAALSRLGLGRSRYP